MSDHIKTPANRPRNLYIDVVKGVVIFLMIWGHCIQCSYSGTEIDFFENPVFKCIYSFHMPLLMLMSGYLFSLSSTKYTFPDLVQRKVTTMVHPIIGGSIFYFVFVTVLYALPKGNFDVLIGGKWLDSLGSLWFLWSVLASSLVLCVATKCTKNLALELCVIVCGIFFVALFPNPESNIYMYPYYVIGYYMGRFANIRRKIDVIKYISLALFPAMLFFFTRKHYIYTSGIIGTEYSIKDYISIDLFRWGIGLAGCVFVMTVVQLLMKAKFFKKLSVLLAKLGEKSLQIYIISVVFLSAYLPSAVSLIRSIGLNDYVDLLVNCSFVYNFIFTPALAVLYCIVLWYVIKLFDKIKISRLIFGR